ncbi:helix-turn-helix domain-containing protein, partial [Patescibacteria group bacterium]|nr:helix-turn-helix domain-containing protein [Patescibacteria group bacterium]
MSDPRLFPEYPGKEFITTSDAARLASVSQTHIGRICRSGDVVCLRVGREWFVEKESLSQYLVELSEKKRELAQKISEQRKKDYQEALAQKTLPLPEVLPTPTPTPTVVSSFQPRPAALTSKTFFRPIAVPLFALFLLLVSAFSLVSAYTSVVSLTEPGRVIFTKDTSLVATVLTATDSLSTSVRNTTENFSAGVPW